MIYIPRYLVVFLVPLVLVFSSPISAIELLGTKVPSALKNAYDARNKIPDMCINSIENYIISQSDFDMKSDIMTDNIDQLASENALPIQLLAFCYAQVEDYQQANFLLTKLLNKQSFSDGKISTLITLAAEIPEDKRPEFNNLKLINTLSSNLQEIETAPFKDTSNLRVKVLLAISKLSLESNQYRNANITLEATKKILKDSKNNRLHGWLAYYYGLYYEKINQQQLAIANLFTANKIADKYGFMTLSGKTKESIANLYQRKHLFNRAIDFASQRVELYINTQNSIKQADSLIRLAILKQRNNQQNESLIYLFNALELIQNKKHSPLLAHVYLELGRTYSRSVINKENSKERLLAQKYLQNARYHFTRLNIDRYQIESLLLLARLNIINDDPALAILQLEKTLQLSPDSHPELRVKAFEMLASSYERMGDHQQAILHFKNFHALQNSIKERLFTLQQLQISEQLQLIERTQQQRQLEIENNELKKDNTRFKTFTYSATTMLILILFSLLYTVRKNRKLIEYKASSQRCLNYHPRTGLASQQSKGSDFNYDYQEKPLYYALVNVSFLSQLNELLGVFSAAKLEKELGQTLVSFFSTNADIFQIRDNQILFISEQSNHQNAQDFVQKIQRFFTLFTDEYQLPNETSIGIVAFPFLNNASRAIAPARMINLTSLALFGASQLREQYQTSSWLELYAIDNLQPAFFDGDLWVLGQKAIQKGIVKINSNQQSYHIYWPELDT